jgi:hypothetical protein
MTQNIPRNENKGFLILLGTLCLGVFLRIFYIWDVSFPLNDGGLFSQFSQAIIREGFRLPYSVPYNGYEVPFSYPPLGFYCLAVLHAMLDIPLFGLMSVVPALWSIATLLAFVFFASRILSRREFVALSVLIFALLPRSFSWMIMGGGVSRSPSFFFAVLSLGLFQTALSSWSWRSAIGAGLFSGLAMLCHLSAGVFLLVSMLLMAAFMRGHGQTVRVGLTTLLVSALIISPWFDMTVSRHGLGPLLEAMNTSPGLWVEQISWKSGLVFLQRWITSLHQPQYPLAFSLAVLGALFSVSKGHYFLPLWWVAVIGSDYRSGSTYSTVPVAVLAGIGIGEVLLPLYRRKVAFLLPFVGILLIFALPLHVGFNAEAPNLKALSTDERRAMEWLHASTPLESRILVVSGLPWASDRASEWLPVLSMRRSVLTPQGLEWISAQQFRQTVRLHDEVQSCSQSTVHCLEQQLQDYGSPIDLIYLPKGPTRSCCSPLLESLRTSQKFELLYNGPGASIMRPKEGRLAFR